MASTMCKTRTRSSSRILHLRHPNYLLPEIATQIACGTQIDAPPPEQHGERLLHRHHVKQGRRCAGFELDQEVDVAVRACRALEGRPEERQLSDVVRPAELRQLLRVNRQSMHRHSFSSLLSIV